MRKTLRLLWLMALPMVLGLSACSDRDNAVSDVQVPIGETPDLTEPTEDQMAVKVTKNVPTAVFGNFEEGTTGAALVKRLPAVTNHIGPDTRMVLVPGSLFTDGGGLSGEDLDAIVRLTLNGGYLAIERPTGQQLFNFAVLYIAKLAEIQQKQYQQMFNISDQTAQAAASDSRMAIRFKTRQANIERIISRSADATLDEVQAEMIIYGPTDYFMQRTLPDEVVSYVHSEDSEGNATQPQAVTTKTERTPYVSGVLADAAAEWLNNFVKDAEDQKAQSAASRALSRADGGSAINELMDASETFTYNDAIDWKSWNNNSKHYTNRVNMTVRSWGIHNMESNKDYYYLKQDVTLKMGKMNGWRIFWPLDEYYWYVTSNYGIWDHWYGAFLSQYIASMNLTGAGSIHLEAAKPETDNMSSSTSISIGSSSSTTHTSGWSYGVSLGMSGKDPSASGSFGISESTGYTKGTSFTMDNSKSYKDLGVAKNTSGNQVTWTYKGNKPYFFQPLESDDYFRYKHSIAPDILVNDCDVTNEICWSVANPSGRYTFNITSQPQTAALLYSYVSGIVGNRPSKYDYCTPDATTHSQELLEPNRAEQTWRMNVEILERDGSKTYGDLRDLQNQIQEAFPDLFVPEFKVADKTADALNTISYIITNSKAIFQQRSDILSNIAADFGIKKFSINWSRDKYVSKQSIEMYEIPNATEATQAHVGWVYGSDGKLYPNANYANGKASVLGVVAYVNDGSDFGNGVTQKANGAGHGLVLAMTHTGNGKYRINSSKGGIFNSAVGKSMDAAKTDYDGLAHTQHLMGAGSPAAQAISSMGDAPQGTTGWFIPSTGQWLAMLCKPGLGGADMPTGSDVNSVFNMNGATKLSDVAAANGGQRLAGMIWTSTGFSASTGLYLVNGDNPRFTWYNWSEYSYVRAAFAF